MKIVDGFVPDNRMYIVVSSFWFRTQMPPVVHYSLARFKSSLPSGCLGYQVLARDTGKMWGGQSSRVSTSKHSEYSSFCASLHQCPHGKDAAHHKPAVRDTIAPSSATYISIGTCMRLSTRLQHQSDSTTMPAQGYV